MATLSIPYCADCLGHGLLLFTCLPFNKLTLVQTAASLLEQLQDTADRDQTEWEAFAQKMYDEVGKARAARNVLQRYANDVSLDVASCPSSYRLTDQAKANMSE